MNLDAIDLRILRILQDNSRLSNQELADKVAISSSACHRRVKHLESKGFIQGYHALLNSQKLGFKIEAFIEISLALLSDEEHKAFQRAIDQIDEVINAYIITGDVNYLLHVKTTDFEAFSILITEKLNKIKGIVKIHSKIVMSSLKKRGDLLPI